MPPTLTIFALFLLIAIVFCVIIYNWLIHARQKVQNAWADIDVWLRRRADIVPSLVETVRAYANYESSVLDDITRKRLAVLAPQLSITERASAEQSLATPVQSLLLKAEAYPELKASETFLELQNALSDCEEKLEMARRYYNGTVKQYMILTQVFPFVLIAKAFRFPAASYFQPN